MLNSFFSPHIFVYRPQTNSVFSLFFRFILILVFLDFFLSLLVPYNVVSNFFSIFLDFSFYTEFVVLFYIIAVMSEEFIDYDSIDLGYWDLDLTTLFNFFFFFSIFSLGFVVLFFMLKFIF